MTKIMIVDDDQQNRELIQEYLSRTLDCEIHTASEGKGALAQIRENNFDLIILDINLPGISGTDILKKTKAEKQNLAFLIVSGWDSLSVLGESLDCGAIDYIPKPYSVDILGLKIKDILSKKNKYFPKK